MVVAFGSTLAYISIGNFMKLEPADFEIGLRGTAQSQNLRARMMRVCDQVRRDAAIIPGLGDLVRDAYIAKDVDPRHQWFCFLPGPAEMKTDFIHVHVVLPQSGHDHTDPWMGLNAEFKNPRLALKEALRDQRKREALLKAFHAVGDLSLSIIKKWVLVETAQRYRWRRDLSDAPSRALW